MGLRKYIYLDIEGIDDLLGQIGGASEVSRSTSVGDTGVSERSFGLEGGASAFGASLKAQGGGKGGKTSSRTTASTYTVSHGDKVNQVSDALRRAGQLVDVGCAGDVCTLFRERLPVYVFGTLPFVARPDRASVGLIEAALKNEIVTLDLDQRSLSEGCSFWHRVFLSASLGKFRELNRRADGTTFVGHTGHIAIWLLGCERGITTNLLAHIRLAATDLYIKPLAMWP